MYQKKWKKKLQLADPGSFATIVFAYGKATVGVCPLPIGRLAAAVCIEQMLPHFRKCFSRIYLLFFSLFL